jgi:hypothetical protein
MSFLPKFRIIGKKIASKTNADYHPCKQCGANLQGVAPNPHTPYAHAKHEIDQSQSLSIKRVSQDSFKSLINYLNLVLEGSLEEPIYLRNMPS